MTDGIFLFVYFYEFVGLIFFVLNINFSEIFKIYIYYVDYATIYISIIIAAILSVAMCIVLHKKKIIEELEFYKKSLIYEYVTGKKEVPEF